MRSTGSWIVVRQTWLRSHLSVPGRPSLPRVLDNYFSFTKDRTEWKGTEISFEFARKANKTKVRCSSSGIGSRIRMLRRPLERMGARISTAVCEV
jgi:hypothetical protein